MKALKIRIYTHLTRYGVVLCAGLCLTACNSLATYNALADKNEVLFLPQSDRELAFTQAEKYSDVAIIQASETPLSFGAGSELKLSGDLDAYFEQQDLVGLIVIKGGDIRLEKYAKTLDAQTRWSTFSVAKSVSSTLVGAAIKDGYIKNLDDLVTDYIPELIGSAYETVTIEQILTMTSGVKWDENYTSPNSDVARFIIHETQNGQNSTIDFMKRLKRGAMAGTKFNYSTGETNLVGVLIRKATGKTLADYLSEKIWTPYGMEADALWALDQDGDAIGGCCISARLRDYARLGQFMMGGAKIDGVSIVPDGWMEAATTSQLELGGGAGYGYLWWTYSSGSYAARGIFGQHIAIVPSHDYVIVSLSNWPNASPSTKISANRYEMLRDINNALTAE